VTLLNYGYNLQVISYILHLDFMKLVVFKHNSSDLSLDKSVKVDRPKYSIVKIDGRNQRAAPVSSCHQKNS
jgi:hypothetical protein